MNIEILITKFEATEQGIRYVAVLTANRTHGASMRETVSAKSQSELADNIRDRVRLMTASYFAE